MKCPICRQTYNPVAIQIEFKDSIRRYAPYTGNLYTCPKCRNHVPSKFVDRNCLRRFQRYSLRVAEVWAAFGYSDVKKKIVYHGDVILKKERKQTKVKEIAPLFSDAAGMNSVVNLGERTWNFGQPWRWTTTMEAVAGVPSLPQTWTTRTTTTLNCRLTCSSRARQTQIWTSLGGFDSAEVHHNRPKQVYKLLSFF